MIPVPFNEQFRLAVLENFNVLDIGSEERFDRITRLASRCFHVPISVISLVGAARQWFISTAGLEVTDTSREASFCGHAIMTTSVFVVPDAAEDPRFATNPLVTGEPHIRFYAGAPLVTEKGFRLGTLCLIDSKPHGRFDKADKAILSDLAAIVIEEIYRSCERPSADACLGNGPAPEPPSQAQTIGDFRAFEQRQSQAAQLLFIASLSHELRTPLNAIIGFSDVLQNEMFGPIDNVRYLEYSRHIHASGAHLARFVDSVLDYVKVEKGEVHPQDDWVDIGDAMRSCQTMFIEQIRKGNLEFRLSTPDDLPLLKADRQLLLQMLVNLVGNSFKFTGPGGLIDIAAVLEPEGGLTLSVRDTGVGIAAENLKTCLTPFGQVRNSATRNRLGTGLGLSLTKRFVELHDGELSIESELGRGTKVELHFPAYRVE